MLRLAVQAGLDAVRLRLDELAVDQMDGPQVWLPELVNWHPTDTPEHVQQLIARYRAFGELMSQYLGNLEDGIRDHRTAPTIAVERVIAQLRALLAMPPDDSPMSAPAATQPPELATQLRQAVVEVVYPAFQRMLNFLDEYLTRHARTDPGVWAVADGEQIYALLARQHTTTELTPDQLHQLGVADLASIHREMRAIMANRGAALMPIRAFTEQLTRDPNNLPTSRAELLQISEQLLANAQAALPRAFGRLPRLPIVVKAVEEFRERDAPAAYYFQANADGSRPATFYINTYEPPSRPKHTLPALAFHEGVPGHHLQIALAQETSDLPAFRRMSAGWLANAFVEGWALYTERLADELGLYPDELARFGMLGYQAWRACRLIVDTGLHHLRWTRAQAIEFFFENVGLTERETVNEVDRYIVWPGQALSYKVGQREIEAVRREQQQRLGGRFDLRAFHDAILSHAAIPLSALRVIIPG
jgi:prolyl oligopeptidase